MKRTAPKPEVERYVIRNGCGCCVATWEVEIMKEIISIDDHMTIDEQIKIIKRARSLISQPATWVRGAWKCEVPAFDASGEPTEVSTNPNGAPKHAYCVEGAINQATYDVLGEDRALKVGAVRFNDETGLLEFQGNEEELGYDPTKLLGIDELVQDQFGYECALEYNDHEYDGDDGDDADPAETHRGILGLLSQRLSDLTSKKGAAA